MADKSVALRWTGEQLRFRGGRAGGPEIIVDGDGEQGPSPTTALLLGLAGCMASDIVDIATKSRVALGSLEAHLEGDRAAEPPRRYTAVRMRFRAGGVSAEDEPKVRRALELSITTYCSVLHSLRPDIQISTELELT
jgi:putative redox protein